MDSVFTPALSTKILRRKFESTEGNSLSAANDQWLLYARRFSSPDCVLVQYIDSTIIHTTRSMVPIISWIFFNLPSEVLLDCMTKLSANVLS